MTFWQFLKQQRKRDDAVGAFAREVLADGGFPQRTAQRSRLARYLVARHATHHTVRAMMRAHDEWTRGDAA